MNREALLASFRNGFLKFRKTPWFRITYLVLLGVIVAELILFTASALACLFFLLIPLLVFVVPYWLGERGIRRFAANGALVFLIAILVAAAMATQSVLAQQESIPLRSDPAASADLSLTNGTVAPYRGGPGQTFTFRVNLTTAANRTPDAFDVFLNLTTVDGVAFVSSSYNMTYSPGPISSSNTRNGTWYERTMTLGGSIYLYGFSASDRNRNWTETRGLLGPITASGWAYYGLFLYILLAVQPLLPIEFLFYFGIVFLWWYTKRSRERMIRAGPTARGTAPPPERAEKRAEGETRAAKAAGFTCTNCGADVSEADKKCPSCGAEFED